MILSYHTSTERASNLVIGLAEGQFTDVRPQLETLFNSSLEVLEADFLGREGEIRTLYPSGEGASRLILLGLGKEATVKSVQKAAFSLIKKLGKKIVGGVYFDLIQFSPLKDSDQVADFAEAFARGAQLGRYDVALYKTEAGSPDRKGNQIAEVGFCVEDAKLEAVEKAAWRGREIAVSQANIMNLINRPGNKLFPGDFAEAAVQSGQSCGFEVTIMDKATIEALGMGGLLGVNKGSAEPPVFIVMEYKGEGENLKKVALVGKGVTFDTGGVSIKPSTNMYYMKSDMGGAAAVFGTMEVVSKLKLPVHLIGIIPATDNKLGADAIEEALYERRHFLSSLKG